MTTSEITIRLRVNCDLTGLHAATVRILELSAPQTFDADYMAKVARARLAAFIEDQANQAHAIVRYHFAALRGQRLRPPKGLYPPVNWRAAQ